MLCCPDHPSFCAVAINGYRITPFKCCGMWMTIKAWKVPSDALRDDLKKVSKR